MNNFVSGWWIIPGAIFGLMFYGCTASMILYDGGVGISTYARVIEAGPPADILGTCASACTMWLANGCVHPEATLTFHGAEYPSGDPMTSDRQDYWDGIMAKYYPPQIADWFMAEVRFGEWQMTGAAAILAGAKPCEEEQDAQR